MLNQLKRIIEKNKAEKEALLEDMKKRPEGSGKC